MAQRIADRRDIDFVLFEQLGIQALFDRAGHRQLNRRKVDMIIDAARQLAVQEIMPTYTQSDREGVHFRDGQVHVPPCFHQAYRHFAAGDWIALAEDPAVGGQGLPQVVAQAAREYIFGASFGFAAFGILNHGAGKLVEQFGTAVQKALFLPNLYSGQWSGSMQRIEPEAGSAPLAPHTSAHRQPDGTFHLQGAEIFITGA